MLLLGDVAMTKTLRRLVFRDTFMVFVDFRDLRDCISIECSKRTCGYLLRT